MSLTVDKHSNKEERMPSPQKTLAAANKVLTEARASLAEARNAVELNGIFVGELQGESFANAQSGNLKVSEDYANKAVEASAELPGLKRAIVMHEAAVEGAAKAHAKASVAWRVDECQAQDELRAEACRAVVGRISAFAEVFAIYELADAERESNHRAALKIASEAGLPRPTFSFSGVEIDYRALGTLRQLARELRGLDLPDVTDAA